MRSVSPLPMRQAALTMLAVGGLLAAAAPVSAQGFGLGARLAWIKPYVDSDNVDVDAERFVGGQMRLLSQRFGLELSLDRHSESYELLNEKVTETPFQASLIMRFGGSVSPYLLGGPGWYRRKVEALNSPGDLSVTTTEFGWHAGVGLEVLPSRHFGIHGDYRYTFLDFHDDDDDGGLIGRFIPGHKGSMWTLGATVYF